MPRRFSLWLLAAFAGLALALALAGIYSTMSYAVAQRTREMGIRLALGAQGRDVVRLVIGEGLKLIALGIAFGLLGAVALTRWMNSLLFAVSSTDTLTFTIMPVLLILTAICS
jgi:ABC-type antimicrobial peptide transport system permease subunit